MLQEKTDLSRFNNESYNPGKGMCVIFLWYLTNLFFFNSYFFPFYAIKLFLLRSFGAKIGNGVIIKPKVNIKYPWNLEIGNHVWIGENVWIDNLAKVTIGSNTCISQGALLICGNHDYKSVVFDLITKPIIIEDGVWIGAKSVVIGGVICKSHSMLSVGSVISKNMEPYSIYKGNPAIKIKDRIIG